MAKVETFTLQQVTKLRGKLAATESKLDSPRYNDEVVSDETDEIAEDFLRLEKYVNINFMGETNSPIGFAMLNGLQNGRNFLWNINLDRRLSKNVQLSLSYEGRKTGTARVVHVGRAQVAATF